MVTNTLGVADDAQAVILFLRDRAGRSPHTLRAYLADLRRLIAWCAREHLGPLSDLTRHDLLAYRRDVERQPGHGQAISEPTSPGTRHPAHPALPGRPGSRRQRSAAAPSRALAVVSSLFRYWLKTGYLSANPAADLSGGAAARAAWTPTRIMPARAVALCDAVIAGTAPEGLASLAWARRCAIWSLYRYGGIRLAELVWDEALGLPRLDVDADGHWTLHVRGKGNKLRAIPPAGCLHTATARVPARARPATRTGCLRTAAAHPQRQARRARIERPVRRGQGGVPCGGRPGAPGDGATRALLRAASTHWLRHGYARTLVVDHAVPLPVAQQLLGHASVQTTAAYAKTDLTQTRAFVEGSFPAS